MTARMWLIFVCKAKTNYWQSQNLFKIKVMLCLCNRDTVEDATNTWKLINDLGLKDVATSEDIAIIRYLCSALSIRAGQFNAASK